MYVVEHDWHSMAWRLCQAYIPRNDRVEHLRTEKTAKVGGHLLRKRGAIVIHREKDALDGERWVNRAPEPHQRVQKFRDAFQGQIFALNRDQNGIARGKCVESEQIERWRAINQNVVVSRLDACDEGFEPVFPVIEVDKLNCGPDQILIRRNQVEALDLGVQYNSIDRFVEHEGLV